jgi:uncharacterized protein (TIGR00369 family)
MDEKEDAPSLMERGEDAMTEMSNRSVTVTWEDPRAAASLARGLSGLDYLTRVMKGEIAEAPIGRLLDLRFTEVAKGRVVVVGHPGEQHYNPIGTVHGGYLSTMLDSAMGCAVHTELEPGVGYSTVSLQINFVRPVQDGIKELLAEGRVIYAGKRQATAEGAIRDAEGRLYAHGMTTCLVLR